MPQTRAQRRASKVAGQRRRRHLERARTALNLCPKCGDPRGVETALCDVHAEQVREWYRQRRESLPWREDAGVVTSWEPTTPPKATHLSVYVPPKGSIAMWFLGRVIPPIGSHA